jgi:actin-related protein
MAEESILVVDVGSSSVKVGFSGEDIPSYVFPSTIAMPSSRTIEVLLC